MTEKKDRLPPPSLLLMRAGRIAFFDAAKGWPDALTFGELAALQYPEEGSASGAGMSPSYKSPKQTDFWDLLNAFEKRGDVQAVKVDRPMPVQSLDAGPLAMWPCDAIERPAAAGFLKFIQEEPSEYVREWLGKEWQATPSPESAGSETTSPRPQDGLTARAILAHPWPVPDGVDLEKLLADGRAKWLATACVSRGSPGKAASLWNPARLAYCMESASKGKRWKAEHHRLNKFIREHFDDWVDEWERLCEYRE